MLDLRQYLAKRSAGESCLVWCILAGYWIFRAPSPILPFERELSLTIKYIHACHLLFSYLSVLPPWPGFAVLGWTHSAESGKPCAHFQKAATPLSPGVWEAQPGTSFAPRSKLHFCWQHPLGHVGVWSGPGGIGRVGRRAPVKGVAG